MIQAYSEALGIPALITPSTGERYHLEMERSLRQAVALGAEAACFGDIDLEGNRAWSEERCRHAGIQPVFPLWQKDRAENVYELVALGYRCMMKSINSTLLPKALLGKVIDPDVIENMKACNIDICGENGEYHTLVVDGPIFQKPLAFQTGGILDFGDFSLIEISVM